MVARPPPVDVRSATAGRPPPRAPNSATRKAYDNAFKLKVVEHALKLPSSNRIKPTAAAFPGLEPVQVRKWIRNLAALRAAAPTAKGLYKVRSTSTTSASDDNTSDDNTSDGHTLLDDLRDDNLLVDTDLLDELLDDDHSDTASFYSGASTSRDSSGHAGSAFADALSPAASDALVDGVASLTSIDAVSLTSDAAQQRCRGCDREVCSCARRAQLYELRKAAACQPRPTPSPVDAQGEMDGLTFEEVEERQYALFDMIASPSGAQPSPTWICGRGGRGGRGGGGRGGGGRGGRFEVAHHFFHV